MLDPMQTAGQREEILLEPPPERTDPGAVMRTCAQTMFFSGKASMSSSPHSMW
jgi:hypothetical protein